MLSIALLTTTQARALELQKLVPWSAGERPALALKDLHGKLRSLDDYSGKVVIVNFWATWCAPCVEEMPSLQALRDRINKQFTKPSLEVVAVNLAESPMKVSQFVKKIGVTFPVLLDRDEDAKDAWNVRFVPATFIVGADGKVRYSYFGEADWASEAMVKRIAAIISGEH